MKSILLAAACLMAGAPTLFSQAQAPCVVNRTTTVCDCADKINSEGSINGAILVEDSGNFKYTFPLQCPLQEGGVTDLTLGKVDLTIGAGDQATLPSELLPDPGAQQFTLTGVATNSKFFLGSSVYFNDREGFGSFFDAQSTVRRTSAFLPVELQYWKAEKAASGVDLLWASVMEKDNDFYSVEYSRDGRNFSEIGQVPGRITSDAFVSYAFHHKPQNGGTHYYRLSQQDFDGTRMTFAVHSVQMGQETATAEVYPNPAHPGDRLRFTAPAASETVRLHYIDGREVGQLNVSRDGASGSVELPANLPAGMYVLQTGSTTTRIVVR